MAVALFDQFDVSTTMNILCLTLVGQDIRASDIATLASVSKFFRKLLYGRDFLLLVFGEIRKFGTSFAMRLLATGKKKEWDRFLWQKLQSAIVAKDLPTLQTLVEVGFDVNYTGINEISPLFLCLKRHFSAGYEYLLQKGAKQPKPTSAPTLIKKVVTDTNQHPYFESISERGSNYPYLSHVFLCVAYHEYEILNLIAKNQPQYLQEAIKTKFGIIEVFQCGLGSINGSRRVPKPQLPATEHSLLCLEIMRGNPSLIFVEFLVSHGHSVSELEMKVSFLGYV